MEECGDAQCRVQCGKLFVVNVLTIYMSSQVWEWPEEKPSASNYYNSAFGGEAPPPKKLETKIVEETDDPTKRVTQVRNYSWSDDTNAIRVYVPVPGVVREGVSVEIGEDGVDMRAATPEYGAFTMGLRRLFDKVDISKSSFKVVEKKEKVMIVLAKFPPPGYGDDAYIYFKPWYKLHHGGTERVNLDVLDEYENGRLRRATSMNQASTPFIPNMPDTKRR